MRSLGLLILAPVVALGLAMAPAALAQQKAPAADADAISGRVAQLEEQMIDLQVVIGTLQSLVAKGGMAPEGQGPAMVAGPGDGDLGARVEVIETQIQALTGQIGQVTRQLAAIAAQLGVDAAAPQAVVPDSSPAEPSRSGQSRLDPKARQAKTPGFGTVIMREEGQGAPAVPAPVESQPLTAPAAPSGGDQVAAIKARALYEDAYGHLLRRDYGAAELGFQQFLAAYPSDELSGNAQYWLGETYYVRGKYSEAATAFLDGYKRYRKSNKAPDSLLKLGMALQQLGEKDAACATLSELKSKFPKAPNHIKQRAASERQRTGC